MKSSDGFVFFLFLPFTESSDDEASGDEGLPDEDSDVSCVKLASQKSELAELVSFLIA